MPLHPGIDGDLASPNGVESHPFCWGGRYPLPCIPLLPAVIAPLCVSQCRVLKWGVPLQSADP